MTILFVPGFASSQKPGVAQGFIDELQRLTSEEVIYAPSQRTLVLDDVEDSETLIQAQVSNILDRIEEAALEDPEVYARGMIAIGHSLGALWITALALELPMIQRLVLLSPASLYEQRFVDIASGLFRKSKYSLLSKEEGVTKLTLQQGWESRGYFGFGIARWKLLRAEIIAACKPLLPEYLKRLFEPDDQGYVRNLEVWAAFPEHDKMFRRADVSRALRELEEQGIVVNRLRLFGGVGHDAHFWIDPVVRALWNGNLLEADEVIEEDIDAADGS